MFKRVQKLLHLFLIVCFLAHDVTPLCAVCADDNPVVSDDPLQGAIIGGTSAVISELVAEGVFGDAEDRLLQYRKEGLSFEEAHDQLLGDVKFAGNVGQLASGIAAFMTGQDVETATRTAQNAIDNNFEPTTTTLVLAGVGAAMTIWAAYDVWETYQTQGPEAALIQAGVEIGTAMIGGQVVKGVFKIGKQAFRASQAAEAWAAYLAESPVLQRAGHKLAQKATELGEKISKTKVYKSLDKLNTAIEEKIINVTNHTVEGAESLITRVRGKAPKNDNLVKKPKNVVDQNNFSEDSSIKYLGRKGRVEYEGVEFRGVRDLGHLSEKQLRQMYRKGINPTDSRNIRLDGHHYKQRYHRDEGAFIVEIPENTHRIANKIQHPLGNVEGGGLTSPQRTDWNKIRKKFNKERAKAEMKKRGVLDE
jgi:hypothetical protein